ncbi:MAG TPA: hypothetical protein VFS54_05410 [Solirubrobacterales bacterium]|nr:hypothetical protein [Solirubrobacterales bacterium]
MFSGGFKRSSRFGLVGVLVVMVLVAAIGLTMGSGEANPKLAMGLIFGAIAVFVVVLLVLQRSDLERTAASDAVDQPDLWKELAIHPIDADAIKARSETWDVGRRSLELGAIVFALIFLIVPSIYLLESFLPLLIGGPLIVIAAIYGSVRAIGPGGELDQGYARLDRAMKPLGLQVTARPKGGFEPRSPTMPGFDYRLRGATELSGERHGRRVTVRFGGHEDAGHSEVEIAAPCNVFEAKSKRVEVRSGPEGLVITRRKAAPDDWLRDLWAAEQLLAG